MEAKDTVMDTIQVRDKTAVDLVNSGEWERIRRILEAQAEISFKAGQEEGYQRGCSECGSIGYDEGYPEGKQVGIREVVEWMEERRNLKSNVFLACFGMGINEWQAKLEEWGIDR